MRLRFPAIRVAAGLLLAVLLGLVGWQVLRMRNSGSPEAILKRADDMSWLNNWIAAEPLYRRAELGFKQRHDASRALYAHVSQMPAQSESSATVPEQIAVLRHDLELPEADDTETRLRILTILGMIEVNYDSRMAFQTWEQVRSIALKQQHYLLASRATGEQGIAAFLLGDIATAKHDVITAWLIAKVADPAAHIRYASVYGAGLVELRKYKEASGPLDEAISVAKKTHGAAYPTIAVTSKIQALNETGDIQGALALADEDLQHVAAFHLAGHLYEVYQTRALVYENAGKWDQAVSDLVQSSTYATQLSYWRGLTQVGGLLAKAYLHQGKLQPALAAINEAIAANEKIPDELYLVPGNLAVKAQILQALGDKKAANSFYEKSADLLDALLSKVPTPGVQHQLLSDLSTVYAGYFTCLSDLGDLPDAFHAIERARGRAEAQALSHHDLITPHDPSPLEASLTRLNLQLLNTDDPAARHQILDTIYTTDLQIDPDASQAAVPPASVPLQTLQKDLHPDEVVLEYVLSDPHSYVLAVTKDSVRRYVLVPQSVLEFEASQYRSELIKKEVDTALAHRLFNELLAGVPDYNAKTSLILIPDGKLHLLPFTALVDGAGQYVLTTHRVAVAPSGTVFDILRHRSNRAESDHRPYVGVAAWTSKAPQTGLLASIRRSVSGVDRHELVPLPESRYEVETIASDLPKPSTVLLGSSATESNFKHLPLNDYNVIHLALHGYADPEFPDRSALVFAPEEPAINDGLLQAREIRSLHLNSGLVTLSACDTGVGPVGEEGVDNIVNAFIEAGAQSVVSTLWQIEDHSTTHLMTVFYDHLRRHEEKEQALRQAQLELLKAGDPPYYWAGFELAGEPATALFASGKSELQVGGAL